MILDQKLVFLKVSTLLLILLLYMITGAVILPTFDSPAGCVKVSGFTIYNSHDYGVYTQTPASVQISNVILADNNLGIWSGIIGPSALTHIFSEKTVTVSDSLIVSVELVPQ